MSKRATRAQIAQETVSILENGWYVLPAGHEVSIREELESAHS
jgi:hypothetical protein